MAPNYTDIERAARTLLDHRDRRLANPVLPAGERLSDLTVAYAIQYAVERILTTERGFQTIGYKIAATNALSRQHLKISGPFFGRLYNSMTSKSPARLPSGIDFFRVYEPEIVVQVDRDLDPSLAPFDATMIERATRAVLPAIEIIGTHLTPWTQAGAANLIADNAAHGHWIIGESVADWSRMDLMDAPITLEINGEIKATSKGRNVDGGPFGATAWLANALVAVGRGLKAGEYITTGSVTAPWPVIPGDSVLADFGMLGRIELRISTA